MPQKIHNSTKTKIKIFYYRLLKKDYQSSPFLISGRRDSNSRQPAWKADALPTELLPHVYFAHKIYLTIKLLQNQEFLSFLQLILYN